MDKTKLGFSRKEAASASSLSLRMIDYLISEGSLRATKIKGRIVIPTQALTRLLEKGISGDAAEEGTGKAGVSHNG